MVLTCLDHGLWRQSMSMNRFFDSLTWWLYAIFIHLLYSLYLHISQKTYAYVSRPPHHYFNRLKVSIVKILHAKDCSNIGMHVYQYSKSVMYHYLTILSVRNEPVKWHVIQPTYYQVNISMCVMFNCLLLWTLFLHFDIFGICCILRVC